MSQNAVTVEYLQLKLTRRPHSPLFARLANAYLDSGRLEEAKELCRAGIDKYPQYTTAHLVLAKCFVAEQEYVSALSSLDQARLLFPDSPIPSQLYAEVEQLLATREQAPRSPDLPLAESLAETSAVVTTEEQPAGEPLVLPILGQASPEASLAASPPEELSEPPSFETVPEVSAAEPSSSTLTTVELPQLAEAPVQGEAQPGDDGLEDRAAETVPVPVATPQAATAPAPSAPAATVAPALALSVVAPSKVLDDDRIDREPPGPFQEATISDEGRIVSKTLAEIYAAQREYGEAVITYRLLMREKPERSDEFRTRIAELERLSAESGRR